MWLRFPSCVFVLLALKVKNKHAGDASNIRGDVRMFGNTKNKRERSTSNRKQNSIIVAMAAKQRRGG